MRGVPARAFSPQQEVKMLLPEYSFSFGRQTSVVENPGMRRAKCPGCLAFGLL
jgi:hypothetical protein